MIRSIFTTEFISSKSFWGEEHHFAASDASFLIGEKCSPDKLFYGEGNVFCCFLLQETVSVGTGVKCQLCFIWTFKTTQYLWNYWYLLYGLSTKKWFVNTSVVNRPGHEALRWTISQSVCKIQYLFLTQFSLRSWTVSDFFNKKSSSFPKLWRFS